MLFVRMASHVVDWRCRDCNCSIGSRQLARRSYNRLPESAVRLEVPNVAGTERAEISARATRPRDSILHDFELLRHPRLCIGWETKVEGMVGTLSTETLFCVEIHILKVAHGHSTTECQGHQHVCIRFGITSPEIGALMRCFRYEYSQSSRENKVHTLRC